MFFICATSEALIPAYFLATEMGKTLVISKVMNLFPVSTDIILSRIARYCSGVLGKLFKRKSISTVTLLSNSVSEYIKRPPLSTKLSE